MSCISIAQEKYLKDEDDIEVFSKKITLLFSKNKPLEAFSELSLYWPLAETEVELLKEKTVKSINAVEDRFGKEKGIVKISTKKIGDVAIRVTYFVKYNILALRYIYTYFHSEEGWILNAFKWDDDFEEEF